MICKHAIVKGRVQGVGFRANTYKEAQRIGDLSGWVINLESGDVEILVQGLAENVEKLLAWVHKGPRLARVDQVKIQDHPVESGLDGFKIR